MTNLADLLNEPPDPIQKVKDAARDAARAANRDALDRLLRCMLAGFPQDAAETIVRHCKPDVEKRLVVIRLPGHRTIRWFMGGLGIWHTDEFWVGRFMMFATSHVSLSDALVAADKGKKGVRYWTGPK